MRHVVICCRRRRRIVAASLAASLGWAAAGCSSKPEQPAAAKVDALLAAQAVEAPDPGYVIQPPDVLNVTAPRIREIDGQQATVRPDGVLSLPLLGDVRVAGLTPMAVATELRRRALKYYSADVADEIAVQVAESRSKVVYVFGRVRKPGAQPFGGSDTLLHVLAEARIRETAWPKKVVLVRPHADLSVRQLAVVDVEQMIKTGRLDQNYLLEHGDIVFVPTDPLVKFGEDLGRALSPIGPAVSLLTFGWVGL